MPALDRSSRLAFGAGALAALVGAYVTTPFVARSASVPPPVRTTSASMPLAREDRSVILPHRDPFAGGENVERAADARIPAAIGVLPPNLGAAGSVAALEPQPRVAAIVTGTHPFALVDDAVGTRIVRLGDRVGTSSVAEIRPDGIRLQSGTVVPLAVTPAIAMPPPFVPPPIPSPTATTPGVR